MNASHRYRTRALALAIAAVGLPIATYSPDSSATIACQGGGPEIQCPYVVSPSSPPLNFCCQDYCSNVALNGYESCMSYNLGSDDYCAEEATLVYHDCVADGLGWPPNGSGGQCVPKITCQSTMSSCGEFYDDCGNLQNCGQCLPGFTCNPSNMSGAGGAGYCTPPSCGVLEAGQSLTQGQSVTSCNGQYTLTMQDDGNLVEYDPNCSSAICQKSDASANNGLKVQALWASGTGNTTAALLRMQGDGNLVLTDASRATVFWSTGTGSNYVGCAPTTPFTAAPNGLPEHPLPLTSCSGSALYVQDDGNLVVYAPATGEPIWSAEGWLAQGGMIRAGGWMYSFDGTWVLKMQGDGNLVLYDFGGVAFWATNTNTGTVLDMQGDGNLVMYDANNHAPWSSGTSDSVGAYLSLDTSGTLSVFGTIAMCWDGQGYGSTLFSGGTCYQSLWQNTGKTLTYSVPSGPLGQTCPSCVTQLELSAGGG